MLAVLSAAALIPFCLLVVSSFTSEALIREGYSFLPREFDPTSYRYLLLQSRDVLHSYGISILTTALGTLSGVVCTVLYAYALSRRDLPGNRFFLLFFFSLPCCSAEDWSPPTSCGPKFSHQGHAVRLILPNLLMNAFFM